MNDKPSILIIDDEADFCQAVSDILSHSGYSPIIQTNPVEAIDFLRATPVDVVLLDVKMPQMDGREVLARIVQMHPEIPVIMITGNAYDVPVAIEAAKKGSFNFIPKPIDRISLIESVRLAVESRTARSVPEEIESIMQEAGIVSVSRQIQQIMTEVERVAPTMIAVLITGESGVGKEVLANAIHRRSARREKPFLSIDCGALTETILESELFGHKRGAFTGADNEKTGLFEAAQGGTIFLDEIGNTSLTFQQKLLQVLNSSRVRRVGDTVEREIDVRVISATNKDLRAAIARAEFREDLFFRLNKYPIHIPPLRERPEDITAFARYLLEKACRENGIRKHYFSTAAIDLLKKQEWRGNVRELDSIVTKLALFAEAEEIDLPTVAYSLKAIYGTQSAYIRDGRPLMEQVEDFEKRLITEALKANGGNQTKAAEQLGVERTNFVKKMKKHNLQSSDYQ